MKKIFIITSYFPPDIGAASNRIFHLAEGLESSGFKVSVITPLPNYPTGKIFNYYKGKFKHSVIEKNITIHRLWIYATTSRNKFVRLLAMLSYSFSLVWFFTFNKIPKTVIVQSPPLLVAFTTMFFLSSKTRKLILNVSDLWPIAGLELGVFKRNFIFKVLQNIERFNYKKAHLVLGQSEEILTHITSLFPKKKTLLYRNYPNFKTPEIIFKKQKTKKLKIVYAGLLGVAQGIFELCQKLYYHNIEFHIYGAGAEQTQIERYVIDNPQLPIIFHGKISRDQIHYELVKYDITIVPLAKRIYGSVPSKIFEYSKLGMPIIYFGGGEGEDIINKYKLGWVGKAGDYQNLNDLISTIKVDQITRSYKDKIIKTAYKEFNLKKQLMELSKLI